MSSITQFSRSPSKKHCSNGDSQLSDLPDGIISQILSCLQTHEAVRTSVLSKDWERKWTSLYDIEIADDKKMYYWRKDKRTLFLDFMERIIGLPLNVKSFHLSLSGSYGITRLTRWISNVFKRDVESLELICRHGNIDLPSSHFSCLSLRKLKLQLPCTFRLFQVPSCFPNLTNLSLYGVDILMEHSINDTSKLTFPVLDTFELKFCTWLDVKYVDIYAPALTTFISENDNISETGEAKYYPVKLRGASVKQCKLLASYWHIQVIQQDHHLLENIGLRVQMQLREFQGLEELELSGDVAKVIAQSKHKVPLPMFYKLKRLVLSSMDSLKPLFELLHAAPSLEFLVIDLNSYHDYDFALESVPSCIISDLEKIEFNCFHGHKSELELAKYLLKNATYLKKLHMGSERCVPPPSAKKIIMKKLLRMPKRSACVTIVVDRDQI